MPWEFIREYCLQPNSSGISRLLLPRKGKVTWKNSRQLGPSFKTLYLTPAFHLEGEELWLCLQHQNPRTLRIEHSRKPRSCFCPLNSDMAAHFPQKYLHILTALLLLWAHTQIICPATLPVTTLHQEKACKSLSRNISCDHCRTSRLHTELLCKDKHRMEQFRFSWMHLFQLSWKDSGWMCNCTFTWHNAICTSTLMAAYQRSPVYQLKSQSMTVKKQHCLLHSGIILLILFVTNVFLFLMQHLL